MADTGIAQFITQLHGIISLRRMDFTVSLRRRRMSLRELILANIA